MKNITVFDTSIGDANLGNQIIMDAINEIFNEIFEEDFIYKLQFAENFGKKSLKFIQASDYSFFGGTNSLSSQMNRYKQMGFTLLDLPYIKNKITLLGLGWWQYQNSPNLYTKVLMKNMFSKNILHSVRDSYTKNMLNEIGILNVINTSCPTTWKLTKDHCQLIPSLKSENVILTLTDYNKSPKDDIKLLNLLLDNYKEVYIWIQGSGDLNYLNSLISKNTKKIKIISPKLFKYDEILANHDIDYIGTRLHAGIRALQHKKRTLIIEIDNRAKEIANDINLNTVKRDDIIGIKDFIKNNYRTELNIPTFEIEAWKGQFK